MAVNTQGLQIAARIGEGQRLRAERDALKKENAELRDELASLKAHMDMAMLAMADLIEPCRGGEVEKLVLVDGWNLILGAQREAHSKDELVRKYQAYLEEHPTHKVWIVFDGPRENVVNDGRLRISYTGGTGSQRADKFIRDFLRMAKYLGKGDMVEVRTFDKGLAM